MEGNFSVLGKIKIEFQLVKVGTYLSLHHTYRLLAIFDILHNHYVFRLKSYFWHLKLPRLAPFAGGLEFDKKLHKLFSRFEYNDSDIV